MVRYLIDANIFIAVLKGDLKLKSLIESLVCALDSVVYIELIQGAKDKREISKIEKYLNRFQLIHIDESISKKSIGLIRRYSKSHNLMLGDAIIAATCVENDLTLITFNVKDFRFIKGLKILQP
jgi:hypothetical protein